jgi:Tetratricopeptide repeat-like domain
VTFRGLAVGAGDGIERPVAEMEDDKQLSRRERRRAAEAAAKAAESDEEGEDSAADEGEEGSAEDAEAAAESDETEEADANEEAEASADEEAEPAERPRAKKSSTKATKPSKTQKKRAKQEVKSATASVRDRNKRLREQAVQRRRGRRDRDSAVAARGLDASEMVDDALARSSHAATQFIRRHINLIQWLIVILVAGGIGYEIYTWRSTKTNAKASDQLMAGVDADLARVGPEPANTDEAQANPRPTFDTDDARLAAASKAFKGLENDSGGKSGTAILATLGEAGTLYDEGKFDEARAKYQTVQSSELAKHDADVRLRALEGVGLCLEAKGDQDGALKSFEELGKSSEEGFGPLGLYHQARVYYEKGDKDKAKELLKKLDEDLAKESSPLIGGQSYLSRASQELLVMIDPTTAPVSQSSYSPEQIDALKAQILKDPTKLKKMLEQMGKMKAPELPVPMVPAPGDNEPPPAPPPSQAP